MTTPFLKRGIWRSQWSTLPAGTAAAPALTFTGDTDTGLFSPAADTLAVSTGGSERVRVSSSGNVGVATTPSAWGNWKAVQITTGLSLWGGNSGGAYVSNNAYFDDSNRRYIFNGAATEYSQVGGLHAWYTGPSGNAGNVITLTERMRLDASGNLGLGATSFGTSAAKVLAIANGTEPSTGPADTVQFYSVDRSAGNTIPAIYCEGSGVTNAAISDVTVTNKIALKVNGTVYYLLATTSAA